MLWWDSYRAVYGAELRAAALGFAEHGWPVVPGEFRNGRMLPAVSELPDGARGASSDPAQVAAWWARRPFGILLATGTVLDVIEAPADVGRALCASLRAHGELVPVAATSIGRWWIPVAAGCDQWSGGSEAAARAGVRLISRGALVPAPPSECMHGFVHWRVSPAACGWRLPSGSHLGELVEAAVTTDERWPARSREGQGAQRPTAVPIGMRS
jgi:hypothetical protein